MKMICGMCHKEFEVSRVSDTDFLFDDYCCQECQEKRWKEDDELNNLE